MYNIADLTMVLKGVSKIFRWLNKKDFEGNPILSDITLFLPVHSMPDKVRTWLSTWSSQFPLLTRQVGSLRFIIKRGIRYVFVS